MGLRESVIEVPQWLGAPVAFGVGNPVCQITESSGYGFGDPAGRAIGAMRHAYERAVKAIEHRSHLSGGPVIAVSGDCFIAGTVPLAFAAEEVPVTTLWLDAHPDGHTWETTQSGFIGGMAMSFAVGRELQWLRKQLTIAEAPKPRVYTVGGFEAEVGEDGFELVLPTLIGTSLGFSGMLHLHVDVDVCKWPNVTHPSDDAWEFDRLIEEVRSVQGLPSVITISAHRDGALHPEATECLQTLIQEFASWS